jgi:DNA-binding CsgD family transcriptional regulator
VEFGDGTGSVTLCGLGGCAHRGGTPNDAPAGLPVALLAAGCKDEAIEALLAARQWPIHVFEYTFQALTTLADALLNGHADQVIAAVEPMRGLSRSTGRAPSWPPPALDGCAPPELPYRGHDGRRRRFPDTLRAFGVTRREADILGLLAAGLTNADIAARLYLSVRTVESHVSSLLAKLGARNRTDLAARHLERQRREGR